MILLAVGRSAVSPPAGIPGRQLRPICAQPLPAHPPRAVAAPLPRSSCRLGVPDTFCGNSDAHPANDWMRRQQGKPCAVGDLVIGVHPRRPEYFGCPHFGKVLPNFRRRQDGETPGGLKVWQDRPPRPGPHGKHGASASGKPPGGGDGRRRAGRTESGPSGAPDTPHAGMSGIDEASSTVNDTEWRDRERCGLGRQGDGPAMILRAIRLPNAWTTAKVTSPNIGSRSLVT